jgi:hypothetical protein
MNTSSSASKMIVMATSRGSIAAAADAGQTTGQGLWILEPKRKHERDW